jgi:hypothetical protein
MAGNFSDGVDRKAYAAEWDEKTKVGGVHHPVGDPTSSGSLASRNLAAHSVILFGRVVDGIAYAHCYRVAFEGGHPHMPCVLAAQSSFLPVGTRSINTLVMGSQVWVILHPQLTYGVIIAVEPPWSTDPSLGLSDSIHGASRSGLRVDTAHSAILGLTGGAGAADWSAGRPLDSTLLGEWGAIAESGMKITLDSAMAQIGADEATGVTVFYHDQLTRVAGYNLQVQSAGSQEEHLDDGGRILIYRGQSAYAREGLGALKDATDPLRTLTAQQSQIDQPWYGSVEPVHDDQIPFHRVVELGGFAGQGGRRLVMLPPEPDSGLYRASGSEPISAVAEEQWTLPGIFMLRASKGIHIRKQLAIPGLRRSGRPEDRNDKLPEDKKVVADIAASDDTRPQLQQTAGLGDVQAYAFNFEGQAPLLGRKDWKVTEESKTTPAANQRAITFGALGSSQYLKRPEPIKATVDTRYGKVSYYPNESGQSFLDDGGVVLYDGYGAAIVMSGGSVSISAPGDIWVKAGRNINNWAGADMIVRAKNGVDISTTVHDVRIKAEGHVQVLAGNGKNGAIMLESRAPADFRYSGKVGEDVKAGGIHFKAKGGPIVAWSQDIYLRTGDPEQGVGGKITLDAGRGEGQIDSYSRDFTRYLAGSATEHFGTEGAISATNTADAAISVIGGQLQVGGYTRILNVSGGITVLGGHIFTETADAYQRQVPTLDGRSLAQLASGVDQGKGQEQKLIDGGKKTWKANFTEGRYAAGAEGDLATIKAAGFSFRTETQYRTDKDWAIYEDRWQQLARLGSGAGTPATWTEKAVQAGSTATYPYPGEKPWKSDKKLMRQDLNLVDSATGTARDRDASGYDKPKFKDPDAVTCDGNYTVIT